MEGVIEQIPGVLQDYYSAEYELPKELPIMLITYCRA